MCVCVYLAHKRQHICTHTVEEKKQVLFIQRATGIRESIAYRGTRIKLRAHFSETM